MSKEKDKEKLNQDLQDSDADGLLDSEEEELGTNPVDADTDHDAVGDYQEVNVYKTNPLDPDTDCDGVEDGVEVMLGRNPKGTGKLIDLFIPNKCNNYRPKALHPHRLAFHALSAVIIKVVMVAFILSFPIQAWLSPDVLYEQSKKIVSLTNGIRASLNIPGLTENGLLQEAALAKAEDMLVNEYFSHVGPDGKGLKNWLLSCQYPYAVAGENLALGFSQAEDVVQAWQQSPTHYANMIDRDFSEIGVAMVGGNYQGFDTTLVAQYFGSQKVVKAVEPVVEEIIPEPVVEEVVEEVIPETEEIVLAEKEVVEEVIPEPVVEEVDIVPVIDQTRTSVLVNKPAGQDDVVFKATAYLSSDVSEAYVSFKDQRINLNRDYNEVGKWTGHKIVSGVDYDELMNPVTLATLTAVDNSGNAVTADVDWENITPVEGSAVDQYVFLKNNPSEFIKPMFDVSTVYYKVLLTIAIIALLLNVFIASKKQHPKTIVSTVGLILLMVFLTII